MSNQVGKKTIAYVFIATSLDGYIAREGGELDWLVHEAGGEDYGYNAFMSEIDVLVMGRNTFEKVMSFDVWPYEGKRVLVVSRTRSDANVPQNLRGKVEFTRLEPTLLLAELAAQGVRSIYVDGGELIQSFLRSRSIDVLVISRMPVLLGKGKSLFGQLESDIWWDHIESRAYPSGLVQSKYVLRQAT